MRYLIAFSLIFLLSACAATTEVVVQQPELPSTQKVNGEASAWAVSVDITPPPGMPMGGYSVMANKGQGFRTRLKARVIYLEDAEGDAMALVQTDLAGSSLLVHHMVAERVAAETGLAPKDIVITASHSHSAPVNFYDNDFYNKHMSSGQWLEQDFLAFVTERISNGILKAYAAKRPARVATGKRDIYGFNRNRSLDSYALNNNVGDIDLNDPQAKFEAVNPALYMVRIDVRDDAGQFLPLAAFSSFSVHATALSVPVEVYNADLFAYAQKDLEWTIAREHKTPWPVVHGLTTGTQGDMAPALPEQGDNTFGHLPVDWKEARKLGQGIGREALALFRELGSSMTGDVEL
ncbi:MAG: neutral/alkaline non-lysosomal ceramidase N-terminal domain-containing protein, partial [Pseudomonadota bacterium]